MSYKKIMIAYAQDAIKEEALALAEFLIYKEFVVFIDQIEMQPGNSIQANEDQAIVESDHILCLCDIAYKIKADHSVGGAGIEANKIKSIMSDPLNQSKVIAIGINPNPDSNIPVFLSGTIRYDLTLLKRWEDYNNPNYVCKTTLDSLITFLSKRKERISVFTPPTQDPQNPKVIRPLPQLLPKLKKALRENKKNHPSIKLLSETGQIVLPHLYPKVQQSDQLLDEIILSHHKSDTQNHLIIEGNGGYGKSVALLDIFTTKTEFESAYIIYIPLNSLLYDTTPSLAEYIQKSFTKEILDAVLEMSQQKWENRPNLTLLLDGLNEIPNDYYEIVKADIESWASFPGIQIIITSRPNPRNHELNLGENKTVLKLKTLDKATITKYLEDLGANIPNQEDDVWKVICIPLMLNLYYKGQMMTDQQGFKTGATEGVVIWNYLQYEISKSRDDEKENSRAALMHIAPYITYKMVENQIECIGEVDFRIYGEVATRNYNNTHPQHNLDWTTEIMPILTKSLNLFQSTTNGKFELKHQQLQDALAAIHLLNAVEFAQGDCFPEEWEKPVGVFVLNHSADLISEEQADKIWAMNKAIQPGDTATTNVLDMQWRRLKGDFSDLDFCGLDLSRILLLPYKEPNGLKLRFPKQAEKMRDMKLSEDSFVIHREVINERGNHGSGRVSSLAFTPDGKQLVCGSWNNIIQIWDKDSGRLKYVLRGHSGQVTTLAVNDKWCVSGSMDQHLRLWRHQNQVWEESETSSITIPLPDENIRTRGNKQKKNIITSVYLSKTDHCYSGWEDGYVRIWKIDENGKLELVQYEDFSKGKKGLRILSIGVTGDEHYCIVRTSYNELIIWDWKNQTTKTLSSPSATPCALAVYNNICVFSDRNNSIWSIDVTKANSIDDAIGFDENGEFGKHTKNINSIVFTPDGKYLATGSYDLTIRVWSMESRKCLFKLESHLRRVHAVTISTDGKLLYSGSRDKTIKVWDMETGLLLKTIPTAAREYVNAIDIVNGSNQCVVSCEDNSIRLWDMSSKSCKMVQDGPRRASLSVSEDGTYCIYGGANQQLLKWNLQDGSLSEIGHTESEITSISIARQCNNENWAAVGMRNGKIEIWDIDNSVKKHVLYEDGCSDWANVIKLTAYKCYGGFSDGYLRIWDNSMLSEMQRKVHVSDNRIMSMGITPNESFCVTGEGNDDEDDFKDQKKVWNLKPKIRLWKTYYGNIKGKNPLTIVDNEYLITDIARRLAFDTVAYCLTKRRINNFTDALHCTYSPCIEGKLYSIVSDNSEEKQCCYFGTSLGYIGYWKYNNEGQNCFDQWQILLDVDITGINLSHACMDNDLREFLKHNGAIIDDCNDNELPSVSS